LPRRFDTFDIETLDHAVRAIADMQVRGAPLIGATAAYGVALALREDAGDASLKRAVEQLGAARPTAVNLRWALKRMQTVLKPLDPTQRVEAAFEEADRICDEDAHINEAIGDHGLDLIRECAGTNRDPVNVLTHCNAGWLATVDWGTALAPVYKAHDEGIPVHVWVDETRPRNQGASLTMWELMNHGVPCTLIVDNAGGLLMQRDQVDLVIVGSDRTTANGDVCNKIGTYLKALAADDNGVPFHVALPCSTIDMNLAAGRDVPIEERGADEVLQVSGYEGDDRRTVDISVAGARAANPAFDITPAHLVTGYITELGRGPTLEAATGGEYGDSEPLVSLSP
jgi:methylthioribose-1-phosphate isomerase